jgi:hypothetical protein
MSAMAIDDERLRSYLAETLPATEMARVEKALRDSAELRDRLERVRLDRADPALHTLGAIWRRTRVTCLNRETLGSYLLDVLEPDLTGYIAFHLDVVECPFCRANVDDLKRKAGPAHDVSRDRRRRIFDSSRGLLSGEA